MLFSTSEIQETVNMFMRYKLDVRAITMGVSLRDCCSPSGKESRTRMYDKLMKYCSKLARTGEDIETEFGVPIINKRIAVTPIAMVAESSDESDYTEWAKTLDKAAKELNVDFIGGFSALIHKGFTRGDTNLCKSIPEALASTDRVCSSVNVGTTKSGINMDAVKTMGEIILKTAELTADKNGIGCAKLVVFCNAPEDNPFMAGAFHGPGEEEAVLSVGVSGPGAIDAACKEYKDSPLDELADVIKKNAFKITRMGQLIGTEAAKRLGVKFGILDLSLAPTPAVGDSVARILEHMGLESAGAPGTTAALALLTDMVKKRRRYGKHKRRRAFGRLHSSIRRRRHDRRRKSGFAHARKTGSDDLRLFGRPRHDRRTRQHKRVHNQRYNRGRNGHRHGKQQNDRRQNYSRSRKIGR